MALSTSAATLLVLLLTPPPGGDDLPPAGSIERGAPSCEVAAFGYFDFWIGEWDVTQEILTAAGAWERYPARSTVRRALDGCALLEWWEGTVRFFWEGMSEPRPMKGLSVRALGPDGHWRIHWMDSRDPAFGDPFVGGFSDGEGIFVRTRQGPDGSETLVRVRFYDIRDDAVAWELGVSADDGSTWAPLWRMRFRRAGTSTPGARFPHGH